MIESDGVKIVYTVGSATVFAFNLPFFRPEDIHCFLTENDVERELVKDSEFAVEVKDDYSHGADITLKITPAENSTLVIKRLVDLTQMLDLPLNGKLPSKELELALDKLTMALQQLKADLSNALLLPDSVTGLSPITIIKDIIDAAEKAISASSRAATAATEANQYRRDARTSYEGSRDFNYSAQEAARRAADANSNAAAAQGAAEAAQGAAEAAQRAAEAARSDTEETADYAVQITNKLIPGVLTDVVLNAEDAADLSVEAQKRYWFGELNQLNISTNGFTGWQSQVIFTAGPDLTEITCSQLNGVVGVNGLKRGQKYILTIWHGLLYINEFIDPAE